MKKRGSCFREIVIIVVMMLLVIGFGVLNAQADDVFSEDFEAGWGAWSADYGVWQIGTPTAGPKGCYEGTKCAGTILNGNYPGWTDSRLSGATMELPVANAGEEIFLNFMNWFSYSEEDWGRVQIRVWDEVAGAWGGWANIGSSIVNTSGWSKKGIELTGHSGETIQIGFYHSATCSGNYCNDESTGWYIDDIQIEVKAPEFNGDFERGWEDWYATRGVWQIGTPTAGPKGCYEGTKCAGTILNGNYPGWTDSSLIGATMELPTASAGEEIFLNFMHWFSYSESDSGQVQIRVWDDAAGAWGGLVNIGTSIVNTSGWSKKGIELTAYSGEIVEIRFYHSATCSGNYCNDESTGWYIDDIQIEVKAPEFNGDFERGWEDWHANRGVWQIGTPTGGPKSCYEGTKCAGTILNGNYPGWTDSLLIGATMELPTANAGEEIFLNFMHWFSYSESDSGQVKIRVWDEVAEAWGAWIPVGNKIENSSGWTKGGIELTEHSGETIQIGFYHSATCSGNYCNDESTGWYIDDIQISGMPDSYYCDKDSDGHFSTSRDGTCIGTGCAQALGCRLAPGDDCNDNDGAVYSGAEEICDNKDNDCDELIDEDVIRVTTCGVGACDGNTGIETCTAGTWGNDTCNPIEGATTEVCDNKDNDCDGPIDEDLTRETACGVGECAGNTGTETCTTGIWGDDTCDPLEGATTETCDNNDNDCDGEVDEDEICKDCGSPHWTDPDISSEQMHLAGNFTIDFQEAGLCDEVAVFDSGDILVGHFIVDSEGIYGDLVVTGDSPLTPDIDEGAADGEKLTIKVWDALKQKERINSHILLVTPDSGFASYVPYESPLAFVADKLILMDIEVTLGCDIALESGWNLFGWICDQGYYAGTVPDPTEYTMDSTLVQVDSLEDALIEVDPSGIGSYIAIGPDGKVYVSGSPFNTLKDLLPGWSYWKYETEDKTISLPGYVLDASSSLELSEGWKQIAYWGDDGQSPEDAFQCIDGKYDVIVNGDGAVYVKGSPFNTLGGIYQSEGYFIHMTQSGTLKYDCN